MIGTADRPALDAVDEAEARALADRIVRSIAPRLEAGMYGTSTLDPVAARAWELFTATDVCRRWMAEADGYIIRALERWRVGAHD